MDLLLSEDLRRRLRWSLIWGLFLTLSCGVFFLGLFLVKNNNFLQKYFLPKESKKYEVFGFAPYWTLAKLDDVDWDTLTTFAYFSLPVKSDGAIDKGTYEWQVFNGIKLADLFARAKSHNVKRVVTLTQMDSGDIERFLDNPDAWQKLVDDSFEAILLKNLDGVNIDFEYIPSDDYLRGQFSKFIQEYSLNLKQRLNDPYITVCVLASSERFNKIYDIGHLANSVDGIFMMAYDFYYPGSKEAGPTAPLYGFNNGQGPYWYDVSTAVSDFLKVADSSKIIMGVPYYGWNYSTASPQPNATRNLRTRAQAMTLEKGRKNPLLTAAAIGGWDEEAKVSWRSYFDNGAWHVVYLEDVQSLSFKYDFLKSKNLAGVGLWALGYDNGDDRLWKTLKDNFYFEKLASFNRLGG